MIDLTTNFSGSFMLAQESATMPPVGGETTTPGNSGSSGTTGAPGSPGSGTGGAARQGSPFDSFIWIIMLVVFGMILFSIMAQRRDKKKRDSMLNAVRKHDRVQTIGGIIGSVVEVKSNTVVLKVDEASNTRMTFARSAVQQVLKEGPESSEPDTPASIGS